MDIKQTFLTNLHFFSKHSKGSNWKLLQVDELFTVPEVGVVVGGTLTSGSISENNNLLIGPSSRGTYERVTVTTMQRNRTACRIVRAGQAASISLQGIDKDDVRKVCDVVELVCDVVELVCHVVFKSQWWVYACVMSNTLNV